MRAQWDLKRFVDTALFFNGPEQVLKRLVPPRRRAASDTIWDPTVQPPMLDFGPLDDVVMGGVSESSFEISTSRSSDTAGEESTVGVFAGTIRTENNGGFAGVRSRSLSPPLRLAAKSGIRMRVRGDGQRYKLIIRDSYDWNGIAWALSFDTTREWSVVEAPFNDLVPTLFARRVPGAKLDADRITTLQLTLSKFEYDGTLNPAFEAGPFRLELGKIEAY